ncbi:MAG: hypothetical protein JWM47_1718 [Acidimicrobiales bacterium]|nr:hypothetical protein [Acidimicrobiales bacterium]
MAHPDAVRQAFRADGFARLPGLVPPDELADLAAAVSSAPERDPGPNPLSLGNMRFASNLFYRSPALQRFLASPAVVEVVTALLGADVWVRWDQAVWKRPGAPAFPMHQDNGYTGLDVEHVQLWVALTAMTSDNGGLVVVPGAHRRPLDHRWVGDHVVTEAPGPEVLIDAQPGDAIVFSSFLPHATTPNTADRDRLAYVAEFLPLTVPDPGVPPPHLVVARDGTGGVTWLPDGVGSDDGGQGPDPATHR